VPEWRGLMTRWWNRMPQFDGLFDFQNTPRPSYFLFKLLARLQGSRLALSSENPAIHGFAAYDDTLRIYNVVVWNFSPTTNQVEITLSDLPRDLRLRHLTFDAQTASNDETHRFRPDRAVRASKRPSTSGAT